MDTNNKIPSQERLAHAANQAVASRAETATRSLRLLLSLSATTLSILIPLSLLATLAPHSRICLFVGVCALSCCTLASILGLVYNIRQMDNQTRNYIDLLKNYRKYAERYTPEEWKKRLSGGDINVPYTLAIIALALFALALIALSAVSFQILFP